MAQSLTDIISCFQIEVQHIHATIHHFLELLLLKFLFFDKDFSMRFLSCEALSDRLNRQTMDFKLPHDVVCTCAKRDEPPSRRQPMNASLAYGLLLMAKGLTDNPKSPWPSALSTAFGGYRPVCEASVYSVYSVDKNEHSCPFVSIRGSFMKNPNITASATSGRTIHRLH